MGEPAEKSIGCSSFLTFLSAMVLGENGGIIFAIVAILYALASLIPSIAIAVRRMHDVGKDWWYIFIPIYNLILCCTEGERRENQYGPDPKAGE